MFCADVSGAFDKICFPRLVQNLAAKGVPDGFVTLIKSSLRRRVARVVVNGSTFTETILQNMVFQGSVWGPWPWNVFFEDAREAINKACFDECVYADDLNAWRPFDPNVEPCQESLHTWGQANRVTFDPYKEIMYFPGKLRG